MAANKAPEFGLFLAIFCILVLLVSSDVTPEEKKLPATQVRKLLDQKEKLLPAPEEKKLPDPEEKKLLDQKEKLLPAPEEKKLPDPEEKKLPDQKLCEKPSATWSGACIVSSSCDKQCINWEHAQHGACHFKNAQSMCFCYVNCALLN